MIADLETQHALDQYHRLGVAGLTPEARNLVAVWYFESRVANGGFERWYRSREGELAAFAPAAFRALGALQLADLAARANAVFGPSGVPADPTQRAAQLSLLSAAEKARFDSLEAEYQDCDDDLDERLETYAGLHRHDGRQA